MALEGQAQQVSGESSREEILTGLYGTQEMNQGFEPHRPEHHGPESHNQDDHENRVTKIVPWKVLEGKKEVGF